MGDRGAIVVQNPKGETDRLSVALCSHWCGAREVWEKRVEAAKAMAEKDGPDGPLGRGEPEYVIVALAAACIQVGDFPYLAATVDEVDSSDNGNFLLTISDEGKTWTLSGP